MDEIRLCGVDLQQLEFAFGDETAEAAWLSLSRHPPIRLDLVGLSLDLVGDDSVEPSLLQSFLVVQFEVDASNEGVRHQSNALGGGGVVDPLFPLTLRVLLCDVG